MIINGTPHEISIYAESSVQLDSASRKLIVAENATPIHRIPAGSALNCKTKVRELSDAQYPFLKGALEFIDADPLPGEERDIVIVSNLYRSSRKELGLSTNRCATVGGTVYENIKNPRPVGCLYLSLG